MAKAFRLEEIATRLNATLHGDPELTIHGIATLSDAKAGHISFLDNPLYRKYLDTTQASAVILASDLAQVCPVAALVVPNPYFAYGQVASLFADVPQGQAGIHPSAVIDPSATVDPSASIGPNVIIEKDTVIKAHAVIGPGCVIGERTTIGERSRLWANVTIYYGVEIGSDVTVNSGVVIGADGFGYAKHEGVWHAIPQIGRVIIGNGVAIGANTTIDRGALEDTVIEEGAIIDNQVQIGHNVKIGAHTAIAGCTGIAGSTHIGRDCMIGGGACLAGHIDIADNVALTGMAGVSRSVREPGIYSSGTPLQPNAEWRKTIARYRNLDNIAKRLKRVEKQIPKVEANDDN
jgi:UDP-3-O-[3-hydroxymyristoyl] glucosamine N-acyltransferase